ncbi:MAG TPA: TIGR03862 family flavoprotein [Lichenihabitans sp.]|jgi:hypothetical protein|nr:TIGR03862 family flavoprotein [Lichenihabitans sp.]
MPDMIQAAVIGAGPAGLMAAETLARGGAAVTLFDRMPSAGRKFLLAGRGGLNLTHSEAARRFIERYGTAAERMRPAVEAFGPEALRGWSEGLGEPTFVGSSGRVFPQSFKASPLLRAWLRRLGALGVEFRPRHRWMGWNAEGRLRFETPHGAVVVAAEVVVLALGGASWPQLGSDGGWVQTVEAAGVAVAPLQPSNCGFRVDWSKRFRDRFEGAPVKGISLGLGGRSLRGEATITRTGIEGGGIYALSAPLRDAIAAGGGARLDIALRPDLSAEELARRLALRPPRQSLSTFLGKALKLAPVAVGLLQEAAVVAGEPLSGLPPEDLAARVNAVPLRLVGTGPIARAISTAGGIAWSGVDMDLMLMRRPGTFVAGEMLDWEAPTGGYLLQGAFATGAAAGRGALHRLGRDS